MSWKSELVFLLRKSGLGVVLDNLRFRYYCWKNRKINRRFRKEYPEIALPPDYMMYEAFQLNYREYYLKSRESAKTLIDEIAIYKSLENIEILDWGCGPARLLRHFPELLKEFNGKFSGCDPNAETIDWCRKNIKGINFIVNSSMPGLPFNNNHFDVITGISIFTHFSEIQHIAWVEELYRILKSGGILYLSLHGNAFRGKLVNKEKTLFDAGKLVVRSSKKTGHRTFAAFQPEEYVRKLFSKFEILKHQRGAVVPRPQQDIWIFRKP